VGEDGVTHHGLFDLSYLRCIPGMTVAAPINEHDLRHLMYTSQLPDQGPWAIRYPRGRGVIPEWECEMHELPVGRGRKIGDGDKVAVLSLGHVGNNVIKAVAQLRERGVEVGHYDMIYLKPLDTELLAEAASRYRHLITVEDGTVVGGLGSAVAEWLAEQHSDCRLTRLCVNDRFIDQGTVAQQQAECGYDVDAIVKAVDDALKEL
jgi:1-deoxy-D-xylulose-5-phosphate synthase